MSEKSAVSAGRQQGVESPQGKAPYQQGIIDTDKIHPTKPLPGVNIRCTNPGLIAYGTQDSDVTSVDSAIIFTGTSSIPGTKIPPGDPSFPMTTPATTWAFSFGTIPANATLTLSINGSTGSGTTQTIILFSCGPVTGDK